MFDRLEAVPPDPILGIIAAYARDDSPHKIDLGIGVYKDENGDTPMLRSVVEAEKQFIAGQTTKTYLGPRGVDGFNRLMAERIFGADSEALQSGRICTVQTPGGTGALRVAGDLIHAASPQTRLWASDPTWPNHLALFPAAGVAMETYPYFDREASSLRFDEMMAALHQRGPGDAVLFHACCHNPCGVSPTADQWRQIAELSAERKYTPVIDIAYMGFERGLEEDALSVRLMTEHCDEVIVASSCSKNFAMYRDRVGAISVVASNSERAAAIESVIHNVTRKNYSMPPAHGPAVIEVLLESAELSALWESEVAGMRDRINGLRTLLAGRIADKGISRDFSFLQRQSGMFSFLGLSVEQVHRLRDEFSIYTVDSARANVASFNQGNIDYFVDALAAVLGGN